MTAMSKRAMRRELRRLRAFERRHARELAEARQDTERARAWLRSAEADRDALARQLRQQFEDAQRVCVVSDTSFIIPVTLGRQDDAYESRLGCVGQLVTVTPQEWQARAKARRDAK